MQVACRFQPPFDVARPLNEGEVRAGEVASSDALFAGVAAEGRAGDLKIYNHDVAFIIQGMRAGENYLGQGGMIVDADVVRPDGELGQDMVDEWTPLIGLGRLLEPASVEVVADGADGNAAVVRARGTDVDLRYITGALEDRIFDPTGSDVSVEYTLEPDSLLLLVTVTVTAGPNGISFEPGDALFGSQDVGQMWTEGSGYAMPSGPFRWLGWVGDRNESALLMAPRHTETAVSGGLELLSGVLQIGTAFGPTRTLAAGETSSWSTWYGVGRDLAALTGAVMQVEGEPAYDVAGRVSSPDGPVAGARVSFVTPEDRVWTQAFTDGEGHFQARVPDPTMRFVVDGRGDALHFDGPTGAGRWSPAADPELQRAVLTSLQEGGLAEPMAIGRGWAETNAVGADPEAITVKLGQPAELQLHVADGRPFAWRLEPLGETPVADDRVVRERPEGYVAAGWTRDGSAEAEVEPGRHRLVVDRGPRFEAFSEDLDLQPGEISDITFSLPQAFTHDGWLMGDPHCHASPSPDGHIAQEDRLVNEAASGVQIHFGTDHDHIADYRPMIEPLGLTPWMTTIVATEMSPVARGHLNLYPLDPAVDLPNGGAWPWWDDLVESTQQEFDLLRDRHGGKLQADQGFVLQANHPLSGLASFAGWRPGEIAKSDFWSNDFDAIEVLNGGSVGDNLELYFDLTNRGLRPTPVGVTDSHSAFGGGPGLNGTYFMLGLDDPTALTNDALRQVMLDRSTIVSRGVFLELSIPPGSDLVGRQHLSVEARSASYAIVEWIVLYENGIEIARVPGTKAEFDLDPAQDAVYVVVADSSIPMAPVYSTTPWAMASALFVDADGDGFEPPLPSLMLE